ncbi:Elongation factor Ts [bioreactor metagenome]|uniref:Elongation factor Ts n=1 Tax=bioreactor metagenome TaxID=1076179 RepID=A0A645AI20_9ZZZZ|nr:translation elongation factor Ts [Lutispora sp.]MEA4962732.1 translation elongation factor Ts [Lutispora sp.]HCJ56411.1 elongation factor Ts [Clostridiaceae bacterium]
MVDASTVKELRERTGAGMMDCKKALVQTDGDMEKAIELLREKGLAAAAKKAGRIAAEGLVGTYINAENKIGAIVEVNCETDFVAKNQDFIDFVNSMAKIVVDKELSSLEELSESDYNGMKVSEALSSLIAKIGENMAIRRFEKFSAGNGAVVSYIHGGGRIGTLVQLDSLVVNDTLIELGKDIAMQVAAMNPLYISESDVPGDYIEKEKEILKVQAINEGKNPAVVEKMIEGRLKKQLKEICLLDQLFVKDGEKTVAKLLTDKSKEIGADISISRFVRFEKGEGIQKREDNFAEEVMSQMKNK